MLLCICCFSYLIGLFSVTWLFLLYKFTWIIIHFIFLSDEGPTLEMLEFAFRLSAVYQPFYISNFYLYTVYVARLFQ